MKDLRMSVTSYLTVLMLLPACVSALEIGPTDDLRSAFNSLSAGDTLVLRGGEYSVNAQLRIELNGTRSSPIVVTNKSGEKPVIKQLSGNHNVLEIYRSSFLEIQGLTFTGGSHGIRLMDSDDVTIAGCEILETGDVALSANSGGTYSNLRILNNHIHHTNGTGEGMYLGCNNDACRIENSLIAGNYVHHTNRANVEQGDGIELKEGSSGNIIRDNVIHDTKYPGILTYGVVGNGPSNIIEGNVIWNTADFSIQTASDAIIRNNIILGEGVGFQSHQASRPANIEFTHNTLIVEGDGVQVRNIVGPIVIANNAVFSQSGTAIRLISGTTSFVDLSANYGSGGLSGSSTGFVEVGSLGPVFVNGSYSGQPPIDLYLNDASPLINAADGQYAASIDFNGNTRDTNPDVGAYEYAGSGNPGWQISPSFKELIIEGSVPKPPVVNR
jgi:parallel beta helix pectate lyase-like protein